MLWNLKVVSFTEIEPMGFISIHTYLYESENVSRLVLSNSFQPHEMYPSRLLCPRNSPGKNAIVDSHFLFQGIFPTHGSNLGLLNCRQILYCLSHQGSPFSQCFMVYFISCTYTCLSEKGSTGMTRLSDSFMAQRVSNAWWKLGDLIF